MVAQQVLNLRQESERLAQNQLTQGVLLVSAHHRATAATFKAQADFLQAKLGNLLAWAQLQATIGLTPGL
jgi:outer membrane protein TolC